jgi:hypothetical protein
MSKPIVKNLILELPDGQQASVKLSGLYHLSEDPVSHAPYICVSLKHDDAFKLYADMGKLSLILKPDGKQ